MAKILKSTPVASKKKLENSHSDVNKTMTSAGLRIVKGLNDPLEHSPDTIINKQVSKKSEYHQPGSDWLIEENKMLREMVKNKEKIIEMLEGNYGI